LGIFGSAALLAAMAAFFNFVLLGINDPVSHIYASNTKFRTGSNHLAVALILIEHGANAKLAALALAEKSNSPELAAYLKARC
jgi:hypothetical protein